MKHFAFVEGNANRLNLAHRARLREEFEAFKERAVKEACRSCGSGGVAKLQAGAWIHEGGGFCHSTSIRSIDIDTFMDRDQTAGKERINDRR